MLLNMRQWEGQTPPQRMHHPKYQQSKVANPAPALSETNMGKPGMQRQQTSHGALSFSPWTLHTFNKLSSGHSFKNLTT